MSYETVHSKAVPNTECHHLISRGALNRWRYYLKDKGVTVPEWLDDDLQKWAPSIRLTKAHHAKTPSYYNPEKMDLQALTKAGNFITDEGELLIKGKIKACFDMEIEVLPKVIKEKYAKELDEAKNYFNEFLNTHDMPSAEVAAAAPTAPRPTHVNGVPVEYATKEYVDKELEKIHEDYGKILAFVQNNL